MTKKRLLITILIATVASISFAGVYDEIGVSGFIGSDFNRANPLADEDAIINPIFRSWASGYINYLPAGSVDADWTNPNKALGVVTGDNGDIVSLGDLSPEQISNSISPGEITLVFGDPNQTHSPEHIRDMSGWDFVVFENGFSPPDSNDIFAELGYVEVSSDGAHFARFPSVSLTKESVGGYGSIDSSNLHNLAGKHPNSYGECVGTPFDLSDLLDNAAVVSGDVDLSDICYVRIVDIPGSGDFYDEATSNIDPNSIGNWASYSSRHPIFDAWQTYGSGGFDLEAIGVLNEQKYLADINLDGIVDSLDLVEFLDAWLSEFGTSHWNARCDIALPRNSKVDYLDFAVLSAQWGKSELWRLSQ